LHIDLTYTVAAMPRLLQGALLTVEVALASMLVSLALGLVLTLLRANGNRPAAMIVRVYISYVRGTPLLVQILLVYYLLPSIGLQLPPLAAGIVALGFSSAAFTSEIMRGGLAAIPKGQIEAAMSLGLRWLFIWRSVILPQLYHLVLPPLVNEFTLVIKATTLVSVITVVEMMRVAQELYNENYRPIEVLIGAGVIFVAMNFVLTRVASQLERMNAAKLG
jgi:His/Glu/Gln/Arg/opine family amino acid ABC transporter permease subunit